MKIRILYKYLQDSGTEIPYIVIQILPTTIPYSVNKKLYLCKNIEVVLFEVDTL